MNDTSIHNTRVLNAGGDVPDKTTTGRYEALLKQGGLWDSCVFFGQADAGCTNDSTNHTSKVFDLMNNADLVQATGTKYPKYNSDGTLLYDGGDSVGSNALDANNPIRLSVSTMTLNIWVYLKLGATNGTIISRMGTSDALRPFVMYSNTNGTVTVDIKGNATRKTYTTTNTCYDTWCLLSMTFNAGLIKIYFNGVEQAVSKSNDGAVTSMYDCDTPLILGTNVASANLLLNGSKTALPQIYNRVLTDAEILWNYNNIKPINLLEQYGVLTGTHINRVETDFGQIPMSLTETQMLIDKLITNNMWDNCVFFQSAGIVGCKKDTLGAVATAYDLKGNADPIQATGTAQPKFRSDGSMIYDGGDRIQTANLAVDNPIRLAIDTTTAVVWFKGVPSSALKYIMCRRNTSGNFVFILSSGNTPNFNRARVLLIDSIYKNYLSNVDYFDNTWHCLGMTFSNNNLVPYIDGLPMAYTASADVEVTQLPNIDASIILSSNGTAYFLPNGSLTDCAQIYNTTFTAEQMLWNYNNLKPKAVDMIAYYGEDATNHIVRVESDGGVVKSRSTVVNTIATMKANNTWNSLSEAWIVKAGITADYLGVTSKLFGLRALHDLTQATRTYQPVYSDGDLIFDATDDAIGKLALTKAQILALTNGGDFTFQWTGKIPYGAVSSQSTLFYCFVDTNNRFYINKMYIAGNKIAIRFVTVINGTTITGDTNVANALVYDENADMQINVQYVASTGVVTSYINNVSMGNSVNNIGNINNLIGDSYDIRIGRYSTATGNYKYSGCAIYKGIIAPELARIEV